MTRRELLPVFLGAGAVAHLGAVAPVAAASLPQTEAAARAWLEAAGADCFVHEPGILLRAPICEAAWWWKTPDGWAAAPHFSYSGWVPLVRHLHETRFLSRLPRWRRLPLAQYRAEWQAFFRTQEAANR